MSQAARELCAYLKDLEDGPVYTTIWSRVDPFWCISMPSAATLKAKNLDFSADLASQLVAAVKRMEEACSAMITTKQASLDAFEKWMKAPRPAGPRPRIGPPPPRP